MMGFGWGFMWVWPIFLLLIGVAVYYAINSSRHEHHSHSEHYSSGRNSGRAIEILKERYARGEITKEQFKEMRKELE